MRNYRVNFLSRLVSCPAVLAPLQDFSEEHVLILLETVPGIVNDSYGVQALVLLNHKSVINPLPLIII